MVVLNGTFIDVVVFHYEIFLMSFKKLVSKQKQRDPQRNSQ